eukprot:5104254-Alexandrium_andersonii.AAC.1
MGATPSASSPPLASTPSAPTALGLPGSLEASRRTPGGPTRRLPQANPGAARDSERAPGEA